MSLSLLLSLLLSLWLSLYATSICIFHHVLSYPVLSCLDLTSITTVIIGMTLYELVLYYHTISYHIILYLMCFLFYLFCWFDLHSILFYSTLFQIDSIWLDLILFYSTLLNSIYYIVQYSISYQWMICVYLSVCLSVRFSSLLSFLMNAFLTHTYTDKTNTYIRLYVPSYDSYILLQKPVSEESYSSDCIISYLI